jgi:hypothetical protein
MIPLRSVPVLGHSNSGKGRARLSEGPVQFASHKRSKARPSSCVAVPEDGHTPTVSEAVARL